MLRFILSLSLLFVFCSCGYGKKPTNVANNEPAQTVNNEPNTGINTAKGAIVPNFVMGKNSSSAAMCVAYNFLCSGGFDPATLNSQIVIADGSLTVSDSDEKLLSNGAHVPEQYVPGAEYFSGCEALYLCNYKNPGFQIGQNNPQYSHAASADDINFRCWSADYTCDGFYPPWNPECQNDPEGSNGCRAPK